MGLASYQRAAVPVIAVNTGVFLAWIAAPRLGLYQAMRRWATHRPASGRVATLLTSVFSHQAPTHFLLNNLALWSVGSCALTAMAGRLRAEPDASPTPHFLAFFVTAGTFASLVSHLVTAARWRAAVHALRRVPSSLRISALPRATERSQRLAAQLVRLAQTASLGSSGAVYAAFVTSALAMPHVSLRCVTWCLPANGSVMFLPSLTVPIQVGMAGYVRAASG